ncbi:MAG TPA: TrmH family RNA methyltransferase [Clostridiales bacterium]|nr:TrmH family RNA methyltransferase [Clostridiales bacterium]
MVSKIPGISGLSSDDGAGADAVFICNRRARITSPKLVKASMGAVFTVPVIEFDDTEQCIGWLKARNFNIYLADTKACRTYRESDYMGKTALVLGSERYGISEKWYSCGPKEISIPMMGICDSLNVGVAASVIIYEISMKKLQRM